MSYLNGWATNYLTAQNGNQYNTGSDINSQFISNTTMNNNNIEIGVGSDYNRGTHNYNLDFNAMSGNFFMGAETTARFGIDQNSLNNISVDNNELVNGLNDGWSYPSIGRSMHPDVTSIIQSAFPHRNKDGSYYLDVRKVNVNHSKNLYSGFASLGRSDDFAIILPRFSLSSLFGSDATIHFPREVDLNYQSDVRWFLHEMAHTLQIKQLGGNRYLRNYTRQALINNFDHDSIPMEIQAEKFARDRYKKIHQQITNLRVKKIWHTKHNRY